MGDSSLLCLPQRFTKNERRFAIARHFGPATPALGNPPCWICQEIYEKRTAVGGGSGSPHPGPDLKLRHSDLS